MKKILKAKKNWEQQKEKVRLKEEDIERIKENI